MSKASPQLILLSVCSSLCLLMAISPTLAAARRSVHHHRPAAHLAHHAGLMSSLPASERHCIDSGKGGLYLLATGDDEEVEQLASRLSELKATSPSASRRPSCYWVRVANNRRTLMELRWLIDRRHSDRYSSSRCMCAVGTTNGFVSLRTKRCHAKLQFLCQKKNTNDKTVDVPALIATTRRTTTTATTKRKKGHVRVAGAATTKRKGDDRGSPAASLTKDADFSSEVNNGNNNNEDSSEDEFMDHSKFEKVQLGPDGRPVGWLPPWGPTETSSTGRASTTSPGQEQPETGGNRTDEMSTAASSSSMLGKLGLVLEEGQRSEFVTLLVLYSVVAVICLVLLGLCVVRCFRSCFRKTKVRYVRQVDADDIPRFMPSSWA